MGHGHVLPNWFGQVHPRFGTPANAIVFVGLMGLVLALSGSFIWLAAMSTVVRLLVNAACIAALPRLNALAGDSQDQFVLRGGYVIPLIALLLTGWLVTQAPSDSWLVTGVFVALGMAFYATNRHFEKRLKRV